MRLLLPPKFCTVQNFGHANLLRSERLAEASVHSAPAWFLFELGDEQEAANWLAGEYAVEAAPAEKN